MPKEVYVLNFDAVLTQASNGEEQLKILESGAGVIRTGYSIHLHSPNRKTVMENILSTLLESFSKVYVVARESSPDDKAHFFAIHQDKYPLSDRVIFTDLNGMYQKKDDLDPNAVVIANIKLAENGLEPFHFKSMLQDAGIHLPVVNGSEIYKLINAKSPMGYIFSRVSPELIPQQVLVRYGDQDIAEKALKQMSSSHFILKPVDGTRAEGIVILPREDLAKAISFLHSDKSPIFDVVLDLDLKLRISELSNIIHNNTAKHFIIQEYVSPVPVHIKSDNTTVSFKPTTRFVAVSVHDTETKTLDVRLADAYYKLPEVPMENDKVTWENSISYSQQNREMKLGVRSPVLGVDLHPAPQVRYVPQLEIKDKSHLHVIQSQVKEGMRPFFQFLHTTTRLTWLTQVLSSNTALKDFTMEVLKLIVLPEYDVVTCKLLKRYKVDVGAILLYNLFVLLRMQCRISDDSPLVSEDVLISIIRYHELFDKNDKIACEEMRVLSDAILGKLGLAFDRIVSENYLKPVKIILKNYRDEVFDFSAHDYNSKAVSHYENKMYGEAEKLFKQAADLYVPGSVDQLRVLSSLISCLTQLEKYSEALEQVNEARAILDSLVSKDHDLTCLESKIARKANQLHDLEVAEGQHTEGFKQFKQEHFAEAKELFESAIALHVSVNPQSARLATYSI